MALAITGWWHHALLCGTGHVCYSLATGLGLGACECVGLGPWGTDEEAETPWGEQDGLRVECTLSAPSGRASPSAGSLRRPCGTYPTLSQGGVVLLWDSLGAMSYDLCSC